MYLAFVLMSVPRSNLICPTRNGTCSKVEKMRNSSGQKLLKGDLQERRLFGCNKKDRTYLYSGLHRYSLGLLKLLL